MINITLTDFLQLSGYRGGFDNYFNLLLCIDTDSGDEEFIKKDCNLRNIIEYQDWRVVSFDVDMDDTAMTIFIKKM